MSGILIAAVVGVVLIAGILVMLLISGGGLSGSSQQQAVSSNLRNLVQAQRTRKEAEARGNKVAGDKANLALAAAAEGDLSRKKADSASRPSLEKRIRYAQWPITPMQFRGMQVFACFALTIPAYLNAQAISLPLLAAFMGPVLVKEMLDLAVRRRFDAFDQDYPVVLLSYVSLLKTGMSPIQGLEAAAKGLDDDSLVRGEVELLVERLRLGLTEEQAIGAFGENIAHPEIELFVQSLILSKRVGGVLSQTLERLAKQVRKRQQFRKHAIAAVAMERGSLVAVAGIMTCLLLYLMWTSPALVFPAFSHPTGRKIVEFGLSMIIFGFYWSRKVTDLKI